MWANPKNWIIVGLAVALIALAGWHYVETSALRIQIAKVTGEKDKLFGELTARTSERDACINQNHSLANTVDTQNAEIEGIKKERDAATAAYIQAEREAAANSVKHAQTIASIRKVVVPKDRVQACATAETLVKDYVKGRLK